MLLAPYRFKMWVIPEGWQWDGPTMWIATDATMLASAKHDFLYERSETTRRYADRVFFATLRREGAWLTYAIASTWPIRHVAFRIAWAT